MMYQVLLVLRFLCRTIPARILYPLASCITLAAYSSLPAKRVAMRRNLRVLLGHHPDAAPLRVERRVRRLARRSMVAYGHVLVDFLRLPQLVAPACSDTAESCAWSQLDSLLASGRGALFITPHFGHWDLAGAVVASHCPPGRLYAVAEEFSDQRLNELVLRERTAYGIGIIPMDNVRQMLRILREGHILCILADRPVHGGDGVPVRFFGRHTQIPAGAAVLATLARCPIFTGYLRRRGDGTFEGLMMPAFEPVRTGNREHDIAATTQLIVDALEKIIRRAPHQWYMFRHMWPRHEPHAASDAGHSIRRMLQGS